MTKAMKPSVARGSRLRSAPSFVDMGYQFADVVSGKFDADDVATADLPLKRVLQPQTETPKLHKVLAQAGMGSRLEMERLILEGRISVNNEPAHVGSVFNMAIRLGSMASLCVIALSRSPLGLSLTTSL